MNIKQTGQPVGHFGPMQWEDAGQVELTWSLWTAAAEGRGLATEALTGALAWAARDWRRRYVVAGHFADNPASGRVLEKAGFLYTGEVRRGFSKARAGEARTRRMVISPSL